MTRDITYQDEIRCVALITDEKAVRFGQPCNRLLMVRNADGVAAGRIKCPRCGALWEVGKNKMKLITGGIEK